MENSAFARAASIAAPVFQPLGFGSWEASGALITGLVAKEVVISTFSQVYSIESGEPGSEAPPALIEEIGQILTSFAEATLNTIRSIPLVVGVNLLPEDTEENAPTRLMLAIREGFETASGGHANLAALAFMVFVLLYTPCMASLAAERQELGTRWMWTSVIGQLCLAWLAGFIIFQGGLLLGLG